MAFALITVVRAVAPTSGKPGDKAILTETGEWLGWVGGSCAEPVARRAAMAALSDGRCRLVHVTSDAREPERPGVEVENMSCYSGGTLELYVEPHLAPARLIVFGRSPIASALCEMGLLLAYRVSHVDPISDGAAGEVHTPPGVQRVTRFEDLRDGSANRTFVVVASHGHFETEALMWALGRDLGYVGLVSSRRRVADVHARLTALGLGSRLPRLRAPAGLAIGAARPQEVALSVLSEIVSLQRAPSQQETGRADAKRDAPAPASRAAAAAITDATPSCCDAPARRAAAAVPSCCAEPEHEEPVSASPTLQANAPIRAPRFSALVLAAGLSRRMGEPNKLLLPVGGEPMVARVVRALHGVDLVELVVIVGHQAGDVSRALEPLGARTVLNPDFDRGQVSSVRVGLGALSEPVDAVMICLGDQPLLTSEDLRRLQQAFSERPRGSIVVPMCGPLRGNPVILDWGSAQETLARGTNFGCRHFLDENPERVYFWQSESDHFIRDIDQPEDYQALAARVAPEGPEPRVDSRGGPEPRVGRS